MCRATLYSHCKYLHLLFVKQVKLQKCLYEDITKFRQKYLLSVDSVCNIDHNSCKEIMNLIIDRKVVHNTLVVYAYELVENYKTTVSQRVEQHIDCVRGWRVVAGRRAARRRHIYRGQMHANGAK